MTVAISALTLPCSLVFGLASSLAKYTDVTLCPYSLKNAYDFFYQDYMKS